MGLVNDLQKAKALVHDVVYSYYQVDKAKSARELVENLPYNLIITAIKDLPIWDARLVCQYMPRTFLREFIKTLIKDKNSNWVEDILDHYKMHEVKATQGTYQRSFYKAYFLYRDDEIENFYNYVKLYIDNKVCYNKFLPLQMVKDLFEDENVVINPEDYLYPNNLLSYRKTTIYNQLPAELLLKLYSHTYNTVLSQPVTTLTDMVCVNEDPLHIYFYARDVKGEDIDKLTDAIIKSGDGAFIYYFAKDIKGADITKLTDGVIESGDPKAIYNFARGIKGADINKLTDAIIKTKSFTYILEFMDKVKGVDLSKFKDLELSLSEHSEYYDQNYNPAYYINRHNQDALVDLVIDTVCKSNLDNSIYSALVFSHDNKLSLSQRGKLVDSALLNNELQRKGRILSILLSFSELKISNKGSDKKRIDNKEDENSLVAGDKLKSLPIQIEERDLCNMSGLENTLKAVRIHEQSAISDSTRKKLEEYLHENGSSISLFAMRKYLKSVDEERIVDRLIEMWNSYSEDKRKNDGFDSSHTESELETSIRCILPEIKDWSANERLLKTYYKIVGRVNVKDFLNSNREYLNEIAKNLIYERRIDDLKELISEMTLRKIDFDCATDLVCETEDVTFIEEYMNFIKTTRRSKNIDENIEKLSSALATKQAGTDTTRLVKNMADTTKNANNQTAEINIANADEIESCVNKIKNNSNLTSEEIVSIFKSVRNLNDEKLDYATDLVCETGDAHLIFGFALAFIGSGSVNKEKLTKAICETHDIYYITEFLIVVHGDKLKNMLETAVRNYGTPEDLERFEKRKSEIEDIDAKIPY